VSDAATVLRTGTTHIALVGGRVAVLRPAVPTDADRVRALHRACGQRTLRDRYLGSPPKLTAATLTTLLTPPGGCGLLACGGGPDGEPLGLAQIGGARPTAEIAVLVRDDQQGRGLGTILARRAVEVAAALGYAELAVFGAADNTGLVRLLIRLELHTHARRDGRFLSVRAPLGRPGRARTGQLATAPR
jgi:GNAT superfamily N-acetyltransferase